MMLKKFVYSLCGLGITGFFLSTSIVHATETPWDREEWILSLQSYSESEKRLQAWHQLIKKGGQLVYQRQKKMKPEDWCDLTLNEWMKACLWRAIDEGSLWAYRLLSSGDKTFHTLNDRVGLENRKYAHLPDFEYYAGFSGLKYLSLVQQEIRAKWEREEKFLNVVPLSRLLMSIEEEFGADKICSNGRRQIMDRMPSFMARCLGGSESQTWRQIVESHIRVNLVPWIRKGSMKAAQEGLDLYIDPVSVVKRWQKEPDYQGMLKASSPFSASVKVTSAKEMHPVPSFSLSLSKQDTDDEEAYERLTKKSGETGGE